VLTVAQQVPQAASQTSGVNGAKWNLSCTNGATAGTSGCFTEPQVLQAQMVHSGTSAVLMVLQPVPQALTRCFRCQMVHSGTSAVNGATAGTSGA
jgi:hypothetical protein